MTKAITAEKPEVVWTVPYVLKLLAEKRDGIEVLKQCKVVSCSGSRCPDELGDLLVSEGFILGPLSERKFYFFKELAADCSKKHRSGLIHPHILQPST